MTLKLRKVRLTDAPRIREIYSYYVTDTTVTFEYEVPSVVEMAKRISDISKDHPYIVCEKDGKVIGYSYLTKVFERAAYQWLTEISVYIDKDEHRLGAGRLMYHAMLQLAEKLGYKRIYALITGENKVSLNFHKHMGFKKSFTFETSGYKMDKWLDVTWMQKDFDLVTNDPPISFTKLDKDYVQCILDGETI